MSLIERAVARLSGNGERTGAAGSVGQGSAPAGGPLAESAIDEPGARRERSNGIGGPVLAPSKAGIEVTLGSPVELALESLREQGFATPAARATATGREFRSIKSLVLEKAFGTDAQKVKDGRRVIVTSSTPGEGKTFCAINLAMSVAATGDQPVLLIDADIARPSIAREMGIVNAAGLIDFLTGKQADLFGLIRPTNIPNLKIVTAGTAEANSGELLACNAMGVFLDRIHVTFPDHLIIIDTPPLLAVTETRTLAQRAGQIVMVVAAGDTPRKAVDKALAVLPAGCNVSFILNKAPHQAANTDYYYGY